MLQYGKKGKKQGAKIAVVPDFEASNQGVLGGGEVKRESKHGYLNRFTKPFYEGSGKGLASSKGTNFEGDMGDKTLTGKYEW